MKTLNPTAVLLASAISVLMPWAALANDTTAELRAGGLVYLHSPDIAMDEEDLFLSASEVRVNYVFRNTSDKDVEAVVAFPMPDVEATPDANVDAGDMEADNFLGFSVTQDGTAITPTLDQHVIALGVDRTEDLRKAGIPLLPYSERTYAALKAAPKAVQDDLHSKGLTDTSTYDAGQGMVTDITPVWTLKSAYWWKTTFPAGKTVRVSHRYKPSVGGTVALTFFDQGDGYSTYDEYKKTYCLDDAFMKTATKLSEASKKGKGPTYTESWFSYVLTTGANWSGPIGKFRLTVDKGKPENYVSFCGSGVKKSGPTTFTMEKTEFFPEEDINVLIISPVSE